MFNPGMLHFSSLTQDISTSCFLGGPQTSMDKNYFSDGKYLFFFFFFFTSECYKYQWTACALKCEAYSEASLHLVLLGGISAYRNLFCLFLLWFFFCLHNFPLGHRKDFDWIGKCSICTCAWFWASLTSCLQCNRKLLHSLQNLYVCGVGRTCLLPGLSHRFRQLSMPQLSSVLGVSLGLAESGALRKVFSMYFLLSLELIAVFSILMCNTTKHCISRQYFQVFLTLWGGARFYDARAKMSTNTVGLCLWWLDLWGSVIVWTE